MTAFDRHEAARRLDITLISSAVTIAVTEAGAIAERRGICAEFRDRTRFAREMLEVLHDRMVAMPLTDAEMLEFLTWVEHAKCDLDRLTALPDRIVH